MNEFVRRSNERYRAGVEEFRGGDTSKPFDGDPVAEGIDECCDLRNYTLEGLRSGRLTAADGASLLRLAQGAFDLLAPYEGK